MGASHDKQYVKRNDDVLEIITDCADISDDEKSIEDLPIKKVSVPLLKVGCDRSSENKLKYLVEHQETVNKLKFIDIWISENRSFSRMLTEICEEMDYVNKKIEGEQARTSILARKSRMSENFRLSFVLHDDDCAVDGAKFPDTLSMVRRPSSMYLNQRFGGTTQSSSSSSFSGSGSGPKSKSSQERAKSVAGRLSSPAALLMPGILKVGTLNETDNEMDQEFRRSSAMRRSSVPAFRYSKRFAGSLMKWLKDENSLPQKENSENESVSKSSDACNVQHFKMPSSQKGSDAGSDKKNLDVMPAGEIEFAAREAAAQKASDETDETSETDETGETGETTETTETSETSETSETGETGETDEKDETGDSRKSCKRMLDFEVKLVEKKSSAEKLQMQLMKPTEETEEVAEKDLISLQDWRKELEMEPGEDTEDQPTSYSEEEAELVQDNKDYSHCSTCDHWYYMPEKNHEELMRLQRKYPQCSKLNGRYEFMASKKRCPKCRQSGKYAYTLPDFLTQEKGWSRCEECHRWKFTPTVREDLAITKLKIDRTKFPFAFSFFAYYYPSDVDDRLLPFRRHVLARAVRNIQSKVHKDLFKQQFGDAFVDRRILSIERKTKTRIALCKMGMKFIKGLPRRRIVIFSPKIEFIHHALTGMEELMPDVMETALFHRPMPDNNSKSWTNSKNFCVRRHKCFITGGRRSSNILRTPWEKNILPHRLVPPVLSSEKLPFRTAGFTSSSKRPPMTNTSGSNVFQPARRNEGNHKTWNPSTQTDKFRKAYGSSKTTKEAEPKPSLVLWKYSHPILIDNHKSRKEEDSETCVSFVSIENRKPLDASELNLLHPLHLTEAMSSRLWEVKAFKFPASYMTNMIFRQNGKGKATSLCLKNILQRFHCSIERIQIYREGNKNAYYKVLFKYKNLSDVFSACEVLGYTLRNRI